ncbi:glycoside hydrolase family 64 protein [Trichoderma citrinoviride]|uniref:Glycoside hydrolase family 64 protein n=1 Tax=Trichoderma citrinoviride TaxID=58853 RepID=A0A2T4AXP8_9HYPO|nr:glycoside hydrolase family 64 protein [Trichoderma citrinoviride]PTB61846.1 glycoside hydrolase family 64 protein [Trichoderma citrinoviride]
MTPTSLSIVVKNNSNAAQLYAYVTGTADQGAFFLSADGVTPYYPASPSATLQPLGKDCAVAVGGPGQSRTLTIPRLAGARVWFSLDAPLTFLLNPGPSGPAVVEPSATNPADKNYDVRWAFAELTLNEAELYVNVSYVDFFSVPVSLKLENGKGEVKSVEGMPAGALDDVCGQLAAQGAKDGKGWEKLVVKTADGKSNLRALSPNAGGVMFQGLFDGYYDGYVDAAWAKYKSEDLVVNMQFGDWGDAVGRVDSTGEKLVFSNGGGTFAKPSAADIFSCSSGPFAGGEGVSDKQLNVGARLAAALNRSTLLLAGPHPEGDAVSEYYQDPTTNHYARICHAVSIGGRGYAFPYDDVGATGGEDQSGFLNDGDPKVLTIGVGGPL